MRLPRIELFLPLDNPPHGASAEQVEALSDCIALNRSGGIMYNAKVDLWKVHKGDVIGVARCDESRHLVFTRRISP